MGLALTAVKTLAPAWLANYGIPISALCGVVFAIFLWQRVSQIRVGAGSSLRAENGREYLLEEEQRGESEVGLMSSSTTLCIAFVPPDVASLSQ
jgi:hypothetical protein